MRSGYGVAAAGLLGLGLLAGCSSSGSSDSTPSASAGVEKDASYSSVMALKDAAVAAGLDCPDYEQTNDAENSSESATCGDDTVLAIYASTADQDKTLAAVQASSEKQILLSGPNWTVKSPDAESLQGQMGGVIVEQTGS